MLTKVFPHKLSNLLSLGFVSHNTEFYLSSTVDKIFTLNGATVSLHSDHLTLLHQNLLDTGAFQDLNTWMRKSRTCRQQKEEKRG